VIVVVAARSWASIWPDLGLGPEFDEPPHPERAREDDILTQDF
jgi:hypothetical protein